MASLALNGAKSGDVLRQHSCVPDQRCAMPTAESILAWAGAVANEWRWLAIVWHLALAALAGALVCGVRVPHRVLGWLLALPAASVGVVAWLSGNVFNALTFAVLTMLLVHTARGLATSPVQRASTGWVLTGAALVAFGWIYPHFLDTTTWVTYVYASPFGLLPCPTLTVLIGITMIFGGLHSAAWSLILSGAGILYGAIGVFRLSVSLDLWLLVGAALLGLMTAVDLVRGRVRATADERTRALPGDARIPSAAGTLTHAITIAGAPDAVWPWLVQMGAGSRAGWYSYDFLDNGRQPSAGRIVRELQGITVGTVFPALPGVTEGFIVLGYEPQRSLVLAWPGPDDQPTVTWAFVLEPRPDGGTRLIVRVRAGEGYRFRGLPVWLSDPAIRLVHFVMQRKQLLEIARRVELTGAAVPQAA